MQMLGPKRVLVSRDPTLAQMSSQHLPNRARLVDNGREGRLRALRHSRSVRVSCEDRCQMPTGATRRAEQPADQVLVDLALQGAGRTAPSPGVCSTDCWKSRDFESTGSRGPRQEP